MCLLLAPPSHLTSEIGSRQTPNHAIGTRSGCRSRTFKRLRLLYEAELFKAWNFISQMTSKGAGRCTSPCHASARILAVHLRKSKSIYIPQQIYIPIISTCTGVPRNRMHYCFTSSSTSPLLVSYKKHCNIDGHWTNSKLWCCNNIRLQVMDIQAIVTVDQGSTFSAVLPF